MDLEPLDRSSIGSQSVRRRKTLEVLSTKLRLSNFLPSYLQPAPQGPLWYLTHSSAIPPVVGKTREVNFLCSISITLSVYEQLLFYLMLLVDLLWSQISSRVCIGVTRTNVKECRSLSFPKSSRMNIKTGIRDFLNAII